MLPDSGGLLAGGIGSRVRIWGTVCYFDSMQYKGGICLIGSVFGVMIPSGTYLGSFQYTCMHFSCTYAQIARIANEHINERAKS